MPLPARSISAQRDATPETRVAIVTGASRGIGRAIALRLGRDRVRVLSVARDEQALTSLVSQLHSEGGQASALAIDLRAEEAAIVIVRRALTLYGRVDVLINCAGATRRGHFATFSTSDWHDGFQAKFGAAVRLCRAAWPELMQMRGTVVNIVGTGARTPNRDFALAAAVNGALLSFSKALADQGLDDGVRVVAINPGPVRTDRLKHRLTTLAAREGVSEEQAAEQLLAAARITRFGLPDDVAGLVAFVVSPAGEWLHGASIDIDGGLTKTL